MSSSMGSPGARPNPYGNALAPSMPAQPPSPYQGGGTIQPMPAQQPMPYTDGGMLSVQPTPAPMPPTYMGGGMAQSMPYQAPMGRPMFPPGYRPPMGRPMSPPGYRPPMMGTGQQWPRVQQYFSPFQGGGYRR